jgi:hypothetical protein
LPQPDGPTSATNRSAATSNVTSRNAVYPVSNVLVTF